MTLFNKIGNTYQQTRQADERITNTIVNLLALAKDKLVADIGAGTGNYSYELAKRGYDITAVEPSAVMQAQAKRHANIHWLSGYAEQLPLADRSVAGVISTLAIHHFKDLTQSFAEMGRITSGPVVIFTFDPRAGKETWLTHYFPYIWDEAFDIFPPIDVIADKLATATQKMVNIKPFSLPVDLKDNFAAAGWRNPAAYLDANYRANISSFRITDAKQVMSGVERLREDLHSGRWQTLFGSVMELSTLDAGYRFLHAS